MSEKKITIRLETKDDYRNVENLTREAFWNVYRPGCMEYYVLHCYRDDPAFVPELDFVMELDGELIGQVIYVWATERSCWTIPWKKPRKWVQEHLPSPAILTFTASPALCLPK